MTGLGKEIIHDLSTPDGAWLKLPAADKARASSWRTRTGLREEEIESTNNSFLQLRPEPVIFTTFEVLGVPVSVTTLDTASEAIRLWSADKIGRYVCIRDVHGIMLAQEDADLRELHEQAAMVTPDGMPLVWLGRHAGHPVERTCGPDLMEKVLGASVQSGLRHYLFGGKPGIAETLKVGFQARLPGLQIVGAETPPFHPMSAEELGAVATRVTASGADVVWIGLSTPKQEFVMRDLARLVPATLVGVGAAFDFHTGTIRRAPLWMQRAGLEWLHRLASEPRRLWRRYLVLAPMFVWLLATRK